jgi:hypothetical protein
VPAPPRDAAQRAATKRLDRAMSPQSLKPDQATKLCVPLANKYGVPAPNRQLVDIVKARTSNHTLPLAARSNRSRRLNTIYERTEEHLVAFLEIAFISILSRRLGRLVTQQISA